MKTTKAISIALAELEKAREKNTVFNSHHEGFAVLKEEVDELWDEVKKKDRFKDKKAIETEAKQVAAMALRFLIDLC